MLTIKNTHPPRPQIPPLRPHRSQLAPPARTGARDTVALGRRRGHLLRHHQRREDPSGSGKNSVKIPFPDADAPEAEAAGEQ